jgi:phosphoribosylanthranilate isomerase
MQTKVKICGVTNVADALAAAGAGADLIGLNFYEHSPRHLTLAAAVEISRALRKIWCCAPSPNAA